MPNMTSLITTRKWIGTYLPGMAPHSPWFFPNQLRQKWKPILIRKQQALQVPSTASLEALWQMHKGTTPSISYSHNKQQVLQGPICKPSCRVRRMSVNAIAPTQDKWKVSSSMVVIIMIINVVVCKLYSAEFEDGLLTHPPRTRLWRPVRAECGQHPASLILGARIRIKQLN